MIAVDLIEAAKAGNNEKFAEHDKKWTVNVGEIATLLSGANPQHWSKKDLDDLLLQHLALTKAEVTARLHHDWAADIDAFDQILTRS